MTEHDTPKDGTSADLNFPVGLTLPKRYSIPQLIGGGTAVLVFLVGAVAWASDIRAKIEEAYGLKERVERIEQSICLLCQLSHSSQKCAPICYPLLYGDRRYPAPGGASGEDSGGPVPSR
jgi:hypothetical protein